MRPLFLMHAEVAGNLQSLLLLEDLRRAFVTHAANPKTGEGRGRLQGVPASTERVTGGIPGVEDREVVLLRTEPEAQLLAVIESRHLLAVSRAVVGALAVEALAVPDAAHVAVLGASADASQQLKTLRLVRSLESVRVWDEDITRSQELAQRLHQEMGISAAATLSVEEAVRRAEIVLCCSATANRRLWATQLVERAHVNVLAESLTDLGPLGSAPWEGLRIIYEDPALAEAHGSPSLGQVLAAPPDAERLGEKTAFIGQGLPFQDLVAAWLLYEVLRDDEDVRRLPEDA
ncbi:MAG TPA: hypothetical protein VK013_09910 [Myxococcaceae bacterium]|nr:hypothetical protein [Myxococcaceae bacterium]